MARSYPEHPLFQSRGEKIVHEALVAQLPPQATVLSNVLFQYGRESYEIDSLVLWPGKGIFLIETKGGSIRQNAMGKFEQKQTQGWREIDPEYQIERARQNFKNFLKDNAGIPRISSSSLVAFPESPLPSLEEAKGFNRRRTLDQSDVADIKDFLIDVSKVGGLHEAATADICEEVYDFISGEMDESVWFIENSLNRERYFNEYTDEQKAILDVAKAMPSFKVVGGAGTGKTFIALEKARREAAEGKSVALMCYSQGLSQYLRKYTESWPDAERPKYVGTFHSLAPHWGLNFDRSNADDDWWDDVYPKLLMEKLRVRDSIPKFDSIVIDEAQDFGAMWWEAINLSFAEDYSTSRLFAFGDSDQSLARREGFDDLPLPVLTLGQNVRSTDEIAVLSNLLSSSPSTLSGIGGPRALFDEVRSEDAHSVADDLVEILMDQGWAADQIAVVTTNHRHAKQLERLGSHQGNQTYYESFFHREDVFYAHINGFKGLERPVIVVAIDGFKEPRRAREALYAALSRARDQLAICGDLDEIAKIAPPKFVEALRERQL